MRRFASLVGLFLAAAVAMMLTVVSPAPADHGGSVSFHDRGDPKVDKAPEQDEEMSGRDFVTADVSMPDGILRWRVEIKPNAGGDPWVCLSDDVPPGIPNHMIHCDWDTTHSGTATYETHEPDGEGLKQKKLDEQRGNASANGAYTVTVSAWNRGKPETCGFLGCDPGIPSEEHTATRRLFVLNPVSAPSRPIRSFDSGGRTARVTWSANPEPDIEKYVIEQRVGDGDWKAVGEVGRATNSFATQTLAKGSYYFRVVAHRSGLHAASAPSDVLKVTGSSGPTTAGSPGTGTSEPEPEPGVFLPGAPPPTTAPAPGASAGPSAETPRGGSAGGVTGSLFPSPSSRPRPPAPRPTTPTTIDPGYSEELPFKDRVPEPPWADDDELAGGPEPRTFTEIITVPKPRDLRALLVPVAGGLAIFVLAMQGTYLARRRPQLTIVEDSMSDWAGF